MVYVGFIVFNRWLCTIIFYHYLNFILEEGYEIPVSSFEFGTKLVLWGYVGVLLAHVCFGSPRSGYRESYNYFYQIDAFVRKYYLWICVFVFCLGMIALLHRLSQVGLSIFTLADLRENHNHSRFGLFQRLSVYGSLILGIFVILTAISDIIIEKVNLWRIVAIIVALLPPSAQQRIPLRS